MTDIPKVAHNTPTHHCPICNGPNYYKRSEGWRPFCSQACANRATTPKIGRTRKAKIDRQQIRELIAVAEAEAEWRDGLVTFSAYLLEQLHNLAFPENPEHEYTEPA